MTGWNYPPGVTGNEDYFQDGPAGTAAHYIAFVDYDQGDRPKFMSKYQHTMYCPWEVDHP